LLERRGSLLDFNSDNILMRHGAVLLFSQGTLYTNCGPFYSFIHSFINGSTALLLGPSLFFSFIIFFFYTDGRTPWTRDQPVARPLNTHRTTQTQNKHTQTFMPWVGFALTIPELQRVKTVPALDRAVTVIGFIDLRGIISLAFERTRQISLCKMSGGSCRPTSAFSAAAVSGVTKVIKLCVNSCNNGIFEAIGEEKYHWE
jgi:hypothetical protein